MTVSLHTHPPAGSELHREKKRGEEIREARSRGGGKRTSGKIGPPVSKVYKRMKRRWRRSSSSPGRRVSSRQQALPRRGWVAPRRPRINKTTARPSPVLGPSCLASACRGLSFARATPDVPTRRDARLLVIPVTLSARANPWTRRHRDAAPRSGAIFVDRAHARSRAGLASRIDI